jgi:predicted Zn-ribbon and HTH transcriptional regulator
MQLPFLKIKTMTRNDAHILAKLLAINSPAPCTEEMINQLLASGEKAGYFDKPAQLGEYQTCPKCKGWKTVTNIFRYGKSTTVGSLDAQVQCPVCFGEGVIKRPAIKE